MTPEKMTDNVSPLVRSKIMASVPQKDTTPELIVRSLLHKSGYRFRLHRQDLPGSPDIVLPRFKLAIFVNGCFWHQHSGCKYSRRPSSNTAYWNRKLDENIARDKRKILELNEIGWDVFVVWQCETKDIANLTEKVTKYLSRYW